MEKLQAGYGLDSNGYIVSEVHVDHIDAIYWPCIRDSIDRLEKLFSERLMSVYIYGSVARGDAVIEKSDLDLLAMFDTTLSVDELTKLRKLVAELSHDYQSLVREVGITFAYYDETMDPANYYENAFLKELCVCVSGEDVMKPFGPYPLIPEIPIQFNGDISEKSSRLLEKLETSSEEEFQFVTQKIARKLIRTFYSMVMVRSQIWTSRIDEQAHVFLSHFPEKKTAVDTLLKWIAEPPTANDSTVQLLKQESKWASDHFFKEVSVRRPKS